MNRALTQAAHDPTQNDPQVSLGEVIEKVEARFADNIPTPILAFSKDSAACMVPSSTFVFLITELLQNANDAIGSNPSASIEVEAAVKGDRLIISVKDTGKGMSDVVLANCTSPFFSTKDNENGHCGLGLHSIYRLVSNLEGTLKVSSTQGQGTTVTISVPRQTA